MHICGDIRTGAASAGAISAHPRTSSKSSGIRLNPISYCGHSHLLFRETGRRAATAMQAGAAGLFPMGIGPWLARLPLDFLARLAAPVLGPLPTRFGRWRYFRM